MKGFGLFVSNIMLLILTSYTTKELKNSAVLYLNNIVCIAMWSLVTYSNCFVLMPIDAAWFHH